MVKVLHVISGLGLGGAEAMLVQLAARLQQRGHPQHVVSLTGRGALADALENRGLQVSDLGIKSGIGGIAGLMRLRRIINAIAPDVVQGWMYHGNLTATLAHLAASGLSGRRLYWNLRASNMDSERYGNIIRWNARLSRLADCIVVNSQAGARFHAEQGLNTQNFEVIVNGIDTDKFHANPATRAARRTKFGIHHDAVLAIQVARVDPMKDHATFLEAMRLRPDIRAVLVGAGTEGLALPNNVSALGMHTDVERFYPAADIVVSSSAYGEGFSNTIAEGMSAGLVPVATDVGDARLIVGAAGKIVPPRDAAALAKALGEVATLAPDRRRQLGLDARARIVEKYTIEAAVANYERLYMRPQPTAGQFQAREAE